MVHMHLPTYIHTYGAELSILVYTKLIPPTTSNGETIASYMHMYMYVLYIKHVINKRRKLI